MVKIEIDGQEVEVPQGSMIIEVADKLNIPIPRFCYHKKLSIAANCRMCLVDVEKAPKALPACATPVSDGMKVSTKSERTLAAQKSVMEFLLINHPLDCPICDQGGECELQDVAMGYGKSVSRFTEQKRVIKDKNIGPLISTDMTRCIHCTRCVRFGTEVAGIRELGATGRGEFMEIGTYIEKSVDSEISGNVIDLCPVGALNSKPFRYRARTWELDLHSGISPHDCFGSNLSLNVRRGEIMRVLPCDNEDINETWISDRDRFSYEGIYSDDRLQHPMIKKDDKWVTISWEEVFPIIVEKFKEYAADQDLGALISPNATVEEFYLIQKLLRSLGTDHIDHRLRQMDFREQDSAPLYPHLGMSLQDIENVDVALVIGSNVHKELPLLGVKLRKIAVNDGAVAVINPVEFQFNFPVDNEIICQQADIVSELAGIALAIIERIGKETPSGVSKLLAGHKVSEQQQAIANQLLSKEKRYLILGELAVNHPHASQILFLANFIHKLAHADLGIISNGSNSAGGWLAGCVPHRAPGGDKLKQTGKNCQEMLAESLSAYLLHQIEPDLDTANGLQTVQTLAKAKFVVAVTSYRSEALDKIASILLPSATFAETSGSYVNASGTWQEFKGVAKPCGEARPAWKIYRVLGNYCELNDFQYESSQDVLAECRSKLNLEDSLPTFNMPCPKKLDKMTKAKILRLGAVPIYQVDSIVRRATSLQQTTDAKVADVVLHPDLIKDKGLSGNQCVLRSGDNSVELTYAVSTGVPKNCVFVNQAKPQTIELGGLYESIEVEKG